MKNMTRFNPENIKLSREAEELARQYTIDFYDSLKREAKLSAHRKEEKLCVESDVKHGRQVAYINLYPGKRRRDYLGALGSGVFGAGLSGLLVEFISESPDVGFLLVFSLVGFAGMFLMRYLA